MVLALSGCEPAGNTAVEAKNEAQPLTPAIGNHKNPTSLPKKTESLDVRVRGFWDISEASCNSGDHPDMLKITDKNVIFYEMTAQITRKTPISDNVIELQYSYNDDANGSGEGRIILTLIDPNRISTGNNILVRCDLP